MFTGPSISWFASLAMLWLACFPNSLPRSQLHGRGVFADANFKRGEVVESGT